MSIHEIEALRHPHVVAFHTFFSEYHIFFDLAAERFRVSIRMYETDDARYFFEQSHHICTPVQAATHVAAAERHERPQAALTCALQSITTSFEDAVEKGHEPCAAWFVRNDVY